MWLAHLAQILSGNTIIYSSYICQKSRLYVDIKIVFEAHKDPTWTFFRHFSHILPCNLKMVKSDKSQTVVDITSTCNLSL